MDGSSFENWSDMRESEKVNSAAMKNERSETLKHVTVCRGLATNPEVLTGTRVLLKGVGGVSVCSLFFTSIVIPECVSQVSSTSLIKLSLH
jgi:hypothetical protein